MNEERRDDLSPDEERVARLMGMLDRGPVRLRPGVRTAVMARVRAEPSTAWGRAWRWLAAPRVSPLATLGLAAAALAFILLARPSASVPASSPAQVAQQTSDVPVRLVFLAPHASSVAVTGDFASWNPSGIPLAKKQSDGVWSVELKLAPGLHHYVFIVDGTKWQPDPNAASQVDDGFGQKNSVLLVPARTAS